jgi:hypothetical protein
MTCETHARASAAARCAGGGTTRADLPGPPRRQARRPNGAPAYYLGRPVLLWISVMRADRSDSAARRMGQAAGAGAR